MGLLGIPTRGNNDKNMVHYKKRNYTNEDAVENLIRYVTRTRVDEDRAGDLITYGAVGADYFHSVENIIQQFQYVQKKYGIDYREGRRMHHEVFNLNDIEAERINFDLEQFWQIGLECSQIYYHMGHQVVFGVHWEEGKRYHIHFAVNSINFINGRKWHTSLKEIGPRNLIFNEILVRHQIMVSGAVEPLFFCN